MATAQDMRLSLLQPIEPAVFKACSGSSRLGHRTSSASSFSTPTPDPGCRSMQPSSPPRMFSRSPMERRSALLVFAASCTACNTSSDEERFPSLSASTAPALIFCATLSKATFVSHQRQESTVKTNSRASTRMLEEVVTIYLPREEALRQNEDLRPRRSAGRAEW